MTQTKNQNLHELDFYFDPISPYAYLAFHQLPKALEGLSYRVYYKPVVFGAILKHFGQLGPAEIGSKRTWTYRQIQWLARELQLPLAMPSEHPFNSLALLRLVLASVADVAHSLPNRMAVADVLNFVWQGQSVDGQALAMHSGASQNATDPARLAALAEQLTLKHSPQSEAVKSRLRALTDEAVALGVFGVPTVVVRGKDGAQHFWGLDSLPLLRAYLQGDPWFKSPSWQQAGDLPVGVRRT